MNIADLQRAHLKNVKGYSTARDEFKGEAKIFLDANENPYGSPLELESFNRYPDPLQLDLKEALGKIKGVPIENTFIGNGSDEAIDLLIKAFCEPGVDEIMVFPPTYGMYEVCANIHNVHIQSIPLLPDFQLNLDSIAEKIKKTTKIIFLCSPNNPSGNCLNREDIETILANFKGLVVVDEAYINFARQRSFIQELTEYPNLVVLQTFSKAWGLAGLRVGMAFSSRPVIDILNKVKAPYNLSTLIQQQAIKSLNQLPQINEWIKEIVRERIRLTQLLQDIPEVIKVFPSDANFILVKFKDPQAVYNYLMQAGIIVRDRSKIAGCEGCLRISIGTPKENETLILTLKQR
ncbi:MAG: histidinol-phosphate transaminase [Pedobacter sp.]|nr:MAG: histidinol-phosphate transaminase [Pedobacter sp.]